MELNLRPPPNSRSYLTSKRPKNRFCRHFRAWATLPPQPKKPRYPYGPHTPPKGTQGHISGVRSALMSKMRKISIVGGFWECDCRVWYIYTGTQTSKCTTTDPHFHYPGSPHTTHAWCAHRTGMCGIYHFWQISPLSANFGR